MVTDILLLSWLQIHCESIRSVPRVSYSWAIAKDRVDKSQVSLDLDQRINIDPFGVFLNTCFDINDDNKFISCFLFRLSLSVIDPPFTLFLFYEHFCHVTLITFQGTSISPMSRRWMLKEVGCTNVTCTILDLTSPRAVPTQKSMSDQVKCSAPF